MKKDKEEIDGVNYFFIDGKERRRELIDRILIFSIIASVVIVISVVAGIEFATKQKYANIEKDSEQTQNENGSGQNGSQEGQTHDKNGNEGTNNLSDQNQGQINNENLRTNGRRKSNS